MSMDAGEEYQVPLGGEEYSAPLGGEDKSDGGIKKIPSLHTFTMTEAFEHEDEGTGTISGGGVTLVMERVKELYPGAVTSHKTAKAVADIWEKKLGNKIDSTILAMSSCCDEISREFENEFREIFGNNFSMGGLAGFPFSGATAFGAMAHHMPQDGSCLIVYGPHVGVDWDGVVGKVNRKGHVGSGVCCESGMAAAAYVKAASHGAKVSMPKPDDPIDAQMVYLNSVLMPHAERLESSSNLAAELPFVMYECQKELMDRIYNKACKEFASEGGKIAFLGGIQINTPEGTPEYFLPQSFELRDNSGKTVRNLLSLLEEALKQDAKAIYVQQKKMALGQTPMIDPLSASTKTYG